MREGSEREIALRGRERGGRAEIVAHGAGEGEQGAVGVAARIFHARLHFLLEEPRHRHRLPIGLADLIAIALRAGVVFEALTLRFA